MKIIKSPFSNFHWVRNVPPTKIASVKVMSYILLSKNQLLFLTFNSETIHQHSSRGCEIVTVYNLRSDKFVARIPFLNNNCFFSLIFHLSFKSQTLIFSYENF